MAHGKSLQLRYIVRPAATVIHKSWELIKRPDGKITQYRTFRAAAHPDRQFGSRGGWDEVELAAKVLGISS